MKQRKGILLAGGSGTRLYPITKGISKQLLPIYDKPMVYYPLSTLMLSGLRDILIITTPHEQHLFQRLLGDGSQWGLSLSYAIQAEPKGLPQAFTIAENFLDGGPCTMILGDNFYYAHKFSDYLKKASKQTTGGTIFAHKVKDPERYGVVEFDKKYNVLSIEEKPQKPKSRWIVTGLYFFNNQVVDIAKTLTPSARGELEIVDIQKEYLAQGKLQVELLGRGSCWFDTGLYSSLLEAAQLVQTVQTHQQMMIACPEEIAFRAGWINADDVLRLAQELSKNEYGTYLRDLIQDSST